MQGLREVPPTRPEDLAQWGTLLLEVGEQEEADSVVDRLRQDGAGSYAEYLRAHLLARQEAWDEARAALEAIRNSLPSPELTAQAHVLLTQCLKNFAATHPDELAAVAEELEEIGQVAEAETLYREHIEKSQQPERKLALAAFLGRQGRLDEALELCRAAWETSPPEAVARTSLGVLRGGLATEAQYRLVDRRTATAIKKHPEIASLLRIRAELKVFWGQYPEAIDLYRQLVQKEPQDAAASTALARLLALQEGTSAEAVALVNKVMDREGTKADLLDIRGVALLTSNDPAAAAKDLEKAVQGPTPVRYFHLARAYLQAQNLPAAGEALRQAKNLGVKLDDIHPLERAAYLQMLEDLKDQ
jgi:tetratricopeptide (TPR) repeat protein